MLDSILSPGNNSQSEHLADSQRRMLDSAPKLSVGRFHDPDTAEKFVFASEDRCLAIVADELRDGTAGESVCELAIKVIRRIFFKGFSDVHSADDLRILINEAMTTANSAIVRKNRQAGRRVAGCSLVLAARVNSVVLVKSVGDCRGYLLRDDSLQQLTQDQTLTQLLVSSGKVDRELRKNRQEVLLNSLGAHDFQASDEFVSLDLRNGDRILLTNRGLTVQLAHHEIQSHLLNATTSNIAAKSLGREAVERGAQNVACAALFAR